MSDTDSNHCSLCEDVVRWNDACLPMAGGWAHTDCSLREVMGGIGHQLAHEYWCLQKNDPDAGLTRRQSAKMVMALSKEIGAEELARRAAIYE